MTLRKTWKVLPPAPADFAKLFPEYSQTVLNLLYHRLGNDKKAITEFFNPDFDQDLPDPFLFRDMEKAVERILKALKNREKIAVYGDYDVDGITSTSVVKIVLEKLGAKPIAYIPDRSREGYGLNATAINYLKEQKVKLIITVDCGIRSEAEIKKVQKQGIDVILTDHHMPGEEIPPAFAVINPKVKNEVYPFAELAGVGVAFKLAQALTKARPKKFKEGFEKWLLDLVALGTIADLVPLVGENRTMVKYGLIVLGKTHRIGLKALFATARLELSAQNPPTTSQISFQIAPRLNAAGRMDHANSSLELLNTDDPKEATDLAKQLETKNGRRQRLTEKIVKEVENVINLKKKVVFEGHAEWPIGIMGLIAGKITDKYARAAFIFNRSKEKCRGSVRSMGKFKVIWALEQCKDLLLGYGGHDYAGGFTFLPKNQEKIRRKLYRIANKLLKEEDLVWETQIDQRIALKDVNWNLFEEIKQMEPFGVGNSSPLFLAEGVELFQCSLVGNGHKHLKMWFCDGDKTFEAIGFGKADRYCLLTPGQNSKLDIVFEISSDEWNGQQKLQLLVRDLRLSP
jgi:single-stranded-DNA-specific exonuclease